MCLPSKFQFSAFCYTLRLTWNRGELESISNELRSLIERDKLQDADNFRSEKDIDAILLDKIINRLNVLTNSNPKIITLEGLIISEPELVSLRSKIYQLLNTAERYEYFFALPFFN